MIEATKEYQTKITLTLKKLCLSMRVVFLLRDFKEFCTYNKRSDIGDTSQETLSEGHSLIEEEVCQKYKTHS